MQVFQKIRKDFLVLMKINPTWPSIIQKKIQENCKTHLKNGQSVYISGANDNNAVRITANASICCRMLMSKHEEADTNMIVYCAYVVTRC